MRLPRTTRLPTTQVNLTPLIDVVFNLVIFFMVASHFSQGQPIEGVELPTASRGQPEDSPHRLTVTVHQDGTYFVGGRAVTSTEIQEMIQLSSAANRDQFWVRVQGDRQAPFRLIEPIMLACARQGIVNFGFDVLPDPEARR